MDRLGERIAVIGVRLVGNDVLQEPTLSFISTMAAPPLLGLILA